MWRYLLVEFSGKEATTSTSRFIPSWHIQEISVMFSVCCLVERVVSPQISGFFFPGPHATIHSYTKTQWNIRVVALLQSILISIMTLWVLINDEEIASMTGIRERLWGYSENVGMICGYSIGYYLWDLIIMTRNFVSFGVGMLLHSVCALLLLIVVHRPFLHFYTPWFILYQISAPFLHIHWFCDVLEMTGSNLQLCNGLALLVIFFWSRIMCGNYQSLALYRDLWTAYWNNYSPLRFDSGLVHLTHENASQAHQVSLMKFANPTDHVPLGIALLTTLAITTLNILNCIWFYKLIRTINRRFIFAKTRRERGVNGFLRGGNVNGAGGAIIGRAWETFMVPLSWFPRILHTIQHVFAISVTIFNTLCDTIYTQLFTNARKLVAGFKGTVADKVAPSTEVGLEMQRLWADILQMEKDAIGVNDNFFGLGGDSMQAIMLVAAARKHGLHFTVADLFTAPTITALALLATVMEKETDVDPLPFEVLSKHGDMNAIIDEAAALCNIHRDNIEDCYTCTPLQESLMALSIKTAGAYVARHMIALESTLEIDRFRDAWETVLQSSPILRTRIVQSQSARTMLQVVVKEKPSWSVSSDLYTYLESDRQQTMSFGEPLNRCAIVEDISTGQSYLIWTMHHAIYDGWSLSLLGKTLAQVYEGAVQPNPTTFNRFIKYVDVANCDAARAFWQSQLSHSQPSTFPAVLDSRYQKKADSFYSHTIRVSRTTNTNITTPIILRAAWALLMSKYENSNTIVIGVTVTGRNAPVSGIEDIIGPTFATLPVRVSIDPNQTLNRYLQTVQSQSSAMVPFEQYGVQNIKNISFETQSASGFQNLLVIQPMVWGEVFSKIGRVQLDSPDRANDKTYPLVMECTLSTEGITILASFSSEVIDKHQISRTVGQFEHVVQQMSFDDDTMMMNQVETASPKDQSDIWAWNSRCPEAVEACVHEMVAEQVVARPDAPAICAWDANFSYRELDEMATRLAHHLASLGVEPGTFVPLCFEKSAWAIVAMLAVLKAGGACVCLNPKHPISRLKAMIADLGAEIIISSTANAVLFKEIVGKVVSLGRSSLFIEGSVALATTVKQARPCDPAFVVFTSGSTGKPKGIVLEHTAVCTSVWEHRMSTRLRVDSRVLQFAAYTFDVSLAEIFSTLTHGACLCVPSEEDRLDNLAGVINMMNVNWAYLTPSVASLLLPADVPKLEVLSLGGEVASQGVVRRWADRVYLVNLYGPAECTIGCTSLGGLTRHTSPANIGRAMGSVSWVVDTTNHHQLMPIGCVGELLIEGPILARGYLNDVEKTTMAFIEDPAWADHFTPGRRRRFYKTGDLVRYNSDGTLDFVGRKDTQVKLHGQRLELGEVEYHLKSLVPSDWQVTVEMIRPASRDGDPILAGFVSVEERPYHMADTEFAPAMIDTVHTKLQELEIALAAQLPTYMMPGVYIPLRHLPLTNSGKTDRQRLRQMGGRLTTEQLTACSVGKQTKRAPSTDMEMTLQRLWAQVLHLEPSSIGADDSFFRLGGDSISAIRVAAAGRADGIILSVATIFRFQKLSDMSAAVVTASDLENSNRKYKPFSSLGLVGADELLPNVAISKNLPNLEEIEDVLPATDYQSWALTRGHLKSRGYNNYFIFRLDGALDVSRLEQSCRLFIAHHPIFRTTFLVHKRQLFQVVMKTYQLDFKYYECREDGPSDPLSLIQDDMEREVELGTGILRFILVKQGVNKHRLVMRMSHAQYDGMCMPTIIEDLKAAYTDKELSARSKFSDFIYSTLETSLSDSEMFWRKTLEGSSMTNILPHTKPSYRNVLNRSLVRVISPPSLDSYGITFATTIKAAWSLVLAQLSGQSDVVFGQIITGRNAPISDIQRAVGPCLNIVPVRVSLPSSMVVADLLHYVQDQHIAALQFESLGFRHIIENCTSWPKWTRFSSILMHTNLGNVINKVSDGDLDFDLDSVFPPPDDTSDVCVFSRPTDSGDFRVQLDFCHGIIPHTFAEELLENLCSTIAIISEDVYAKLPVPIDTSQLIFPIPLPIVSSGPSYTPDFDLSHRTSANPKLIVKKAWETVLGGGQIGTSTAYTLDMPFYDVWGDLIAAVQFAAFYRKEEQLAVSVEDIIEHPTMRLQMQLLGLDGKDEPGSPLTSVYE